MTIELKLPDQTLKKLDNHLIVVQPATEEDYFDISSEDLKVEYSPGVLYIHSPASFKHEEINIFLIRYFRKFFDRKGDIKVFGSRTAIKLPNNHRPEPDLVLLYTEQINEEMTIFKGVPPFIIEIVSEGTKNHEYSNKLKWYKNAQVPEIWYISPEQKTVEVYILKDNQYIMNEYTTEIISPSSFSELQLNLNWLWEFPTPNLDELNI